MTPSSTPSFSLSAERYDQSSYMGRFQKMLNIVDPSTLFASNAKVVEASETIKKWQAGTLQEQLSDEALWGLRKLKESAMHPDTGELIPRPFRMSGYVPYNGPVCVGAVMAQSTHWILFWHWVNQSQNALVNYYNRNASSKITVQTLALSYSCAVGTAVTVAFGLATAIKKCLSPAAATLALRWVALPASCLASCGNCFIMRRSELTTGITVVDGEGNSVGVSQAAARKAMKEMLFSRAVLQPPVFGIPPLIMSLPPIVAATKKYPKLALPISTVSLLVGFQFGLPASIALFPQKGSISVKELEPELQAAIGRSGKPLTVVYYNKGL